ncbi:hypothetical protein LWI29_029991 [Acer saccharum]|uniref:Integrase catalytic domain-containing protein n=1 Tax=Acer saccharum TaxID=4024 RepID=A0AA39S0J9_ACESA|nr:hypothetical protein LWI29_029991 [Acer saccharum]
MGSVQRRKSLAYLSNLKQERNESIKKYLARFGKEVAQIETASDVVVIVAFTNGLQSGQLFFDLRRDRPKTYEEMMEIAGDYALAKANTISFVKKNILYRFGIPNTIITDNGTQFDGKKFRELCDKYGINNYYASPAHPQTNGQTEAVNKIIKHNLKVKLAAKKGSWVDKLPQVL